MKFDIPDKNMRELYTKGANKKYKFVDKSLAKKVVERIGRIDAAETIYDLREPPSMEFEKLAGSENRFSIRLDKKHRLEFEIDFEDENKTFGTVHIITVSKHYQ